MIYRAYVLGAALILALASVLGNENDSGVDSSFNAAVNVMRRLSEGSPQAARYCTILKSLQQDLEAWQIQRARERRQSALRPVTDLLQSCNGASGADTSEGTFNQRDLDLIAIDWEEAFSMGDELWTTALPEDMSLPFTPL